MSIWQRFKSGLGLAAKKEESYPFGVTLAEKDTITAIRDLSRAVMNNQDAAEIYLALGSLYRSRGDLERAVQIRESLLVRPELSSELKGKTYFELGQDYRRAGLVDRAFSSYIEAERLGVASSLVNAELAALYSSSGNWEKAVEYYHALGNKIAEAHYLVCQGQELLKNAPAERRKAMRFFNKALKVYLGATEAWVGIISQYAYLGKWNAAAKALGKALEAIPTEKSFMLFEELILLEPAPNARQNDAKEPELPDENSKIIFNAAMADAFIPVLEKRPPEFFPNYYGSIMLSRVSRREDAEKWLDKALIMQPDFWYGRLLHLDIVRHAHTLPPVLDTDVEFFINQSRNLRRFSCSVCALRRGQLFYVCPRCGSWHSAVFQASLTD